MQNTLKFDFCFFKKTFSSLISFIPFLFYNDLFLFLKMYDAQILDKIFF